MYLSEPTPSPRAPRAGGPSSEHASEADRLGALHAYDILDTESEEGFDRITTLASRLLGVPIALVSLVDRDRQWFKSCVGLDAESTPRSESFCTHAIAQPGVMVVEDARADARFAENPLVTGPPHIRFYAGMPLSVAGGHRIGTLCVIDRAPRTLAASELETLESLAAFVVDELALRREVAERRAAEARYRTFFESANDAVLILRPEDEVVLEANKRAAELYGVSREALIGQSLRAFSRDDAGGRALVRRAERNGRLSFESPQQRADGTPLTVRVSASMIEFRGETAILSHNRDVTALKRAQEEVERREAHFRTLIHNSSDVITVLDGEGGIVYQSPSVRAVLGYAPEELVGESVFPHIHPDDAEAVGTAFAGLIAVPEQSVPATFRWRHRDGSWVYLEAVGTNCLGDPAVQGIVVNSRDVTRRLAAEAELRAATSRARRLALAVAHSVNGVMITDAEGRTEWCNEGFTRISGYSLDEMRGRIPGSVLQGPGTDAEARQRMRRAIERVEGFDVEVTNYHKNGQPYIIRIEAQPLFEEDATHSGFMAIETDVTDARRATAALRASEERYRTVVESVRDAVLQTDLEGRWTFLNPAWTEITGFTVEETLGRPSYEFVHPDERPRHDELFAPLVEGTAPFVRFETRYLTKSGGYRHVEVHAQLSHNAAGEVVGTSGTVTDLTDTRRFEAEREAREKTEEMLRLKSAFLNNMSHEIRTPLTGILGFAEVLAEEVGDEHREPVEVIHRSATRLRDTLNSVLDLAQLESGEVKMAPVALDLREEVREAMQLLEPLAEGKGLGLHLAAGPTPAAVDRTALHRIVNNLVGNAIKFTDEGHVFVEVEAAGADVRLRVSDTGPGIDAAFHGRVFEEFKQASEGLDRSHEGTGLGLAITRHLVEVMGGTVALESTVGEGAVFTVTLPRSSEPRSSEAAGADPGPADPNPTGAR